MFAWWKPRVLPLTHKILISHQIKHHLKWWTNRDRFIQDVPLKPVQETHTLFTDASVSGWGAHLDSKRLLFHGVWTNDQSQLHIDVLEMMAISMALERAHHVIHNFTVNVTDNASVVSYIIKQRGTFPNLVYGSLEPSVVVSSKGNNSESQTYPWHIQHPGRPSLKNVETCSDQMVSQSDNSQSGLFNDGVSQHRSVCDSSQQQTSSVCVTYSRQQNSGNRCPDNQLGSYPWLCISPVSCHS